MFGPPPSDPSPSLVRHHRPGHHEVDTDGGRVDVAGGVQPARTQHRQDEREELGMGVDDEREPCGAMEALVWDFLDTEYARWLDQKSVEQIGDLSGWRPTGIRLEPPRLTP